MNIAFFLTPKADVAWVQTTATLRQALEKMEHYRYTAVPLLTPEGQYGGTLTEGDLLRFIKQNPELTFGDTGWTPLSAVPRHLDIKPVRIDQDIEALFTLALDQNFVPVVDDRGAFIGIVRRRQILEFLLKKLEGLTAERER